MVIENGFQIAQTSIGAEADQHQQAAEATEAAGDHVAGGLGPGLDAAVERA